MDRNVCILEYRHFSRNRLVARQRGWCRGSAKRPMIIMIMVIMEMIRVSRCKIPHPMIRRVRMFWAAPRATYQSMGRPWVCERVGGGSVDQGIDVHVIWERSWTWTGPPGGIPWGGSWYPKGLGERTRRVYVSENHDGWMKHRTDRTTLIASWDNENDRYNCD